MVGLGGKSNMEKPAGTIPLNRSKLTMVVSFKAYFPACMSISSKRPPLKPIAVTLLTEVVPVKPTVELELPVLVLLPSPLVLLPSPGFGGLLGGVGGPPAPGLPDPGPGGGDGPPEEPGGGGGGFGSLSKAAVIGCWCCSGDMFN